MDNKSIVCPWCGGEMERGSIRSTGKLCFLPDGEKMPRVFTEAAIKKGNGIPLLPSLFGLLDTDSNSSWQAAFVCRSCKKIIIPYE